MFSRFFRFFGEFLGIQIFLNNLKFFRSFWSFFVQMLLGFLVLLFFVFPRNCIFCANPEWPCLTKTNWPLCSIKIFFLLEIDSSFPVNLFLCLSPDFKQKVSVWSITLLYNSKLVLLEVLSSLKKCSCSFESNSWFSTFFPFNQSLENFSLWSAVFLFELFLSNQTLDFRQSCRCITLAFYQKLLLLNLHAFLQLFFFRLIKPFLVFISVFLSGAFSLLDIFFFKIRFFLSSTTILFASESRS